MKNLWVCCTRKNKIKKTQRRIHGASISQRSCSSGWVLVLIRGSVLQWRELGHRSATLVNTREVRSRRGAARRRLPGLDISPRPRSRLARLTREDEVSELCIVGALFRILAFSQQTARSLLYADTATVTTRAAPEPFITAPFLSRGCFVMIFVANWYPWTR